MHRTATLVLTIFLSCFLCLTEGFAQGTWTPLTFAPDYNQGVMILLTDGSVLVKTTSGGIGLFGTGSGWNRLRPDIHGSYANGRWSTAAYMSDTRLYFSTQVLKTGMLYVAGGEYGTGKNKAEIYNPITDTWSSTQPLTNPIDTIFDANSSLLPDGKVLQAIVLTGDTLSRHTYLFDPATNAYTPGPRTIGYDDEATWLKLPDQSVLFPDLYTNQSERYIPATNSWVADSTLPVKLFDTFGHEMGPGFLLPDGRAFFIGSTSNTAYYQPSHTGARGIWTAGPTIPGKLGAPDAAGAMMPNGKILVALSHAPTKDTTFYRHTVFYEFDYLTSSYNKIKCPDGSDSLDVPSYYSNMLCLPDGSILYGSQYDDQYYVYMPADTPLTAGKPVVDSILGNNCDTFMATGHLFNGICEGACYGDDWQMTTNYPLVRISRNDTVIYATTFNWNSTGVMRDSSRDSVTFIIPYKTKPGLYQLQVVANGNASVSVPFNVCDKKSISATTATSPSFNLYPNPADNQITIELTNHSLKDATIKICNISGQVLLALPLNHSTTIDTHSLSPGLYFVSLRINGEVVETKKLLIEK